VLSLLLVTHDRSFLERTCGEILELDNAAVYSYQVSTAIVSIAIVSIASS
tara:strand:+ start:136 stop:285 length:150 start_codon:yes stop_codon:yes gene_type:complete